MAESVNPPAVVPIAGLLVPAELVPSIIAAMRGLYPTVTSTLDDEAAVRAVLKHWVTATLSTFASQQATAPVPEQLAAIEAEARLREQLAREEAERAAQTITEAPPASSAVDLTPFK